MGYTASAAAAAPVQDPGIGIRQDSNHTTAWTEVSDIPQKECGKKWQCNDFDYDSGRGHYVEYSCACDDLCVLLQDCCPGAALHRAGSTSDASSPRRATAGASSGPAGQQADARVLAGTGAASAEKSSGTQRMSTSVHSENGEPGGSESGSVAYRANSEFGLLRGEKPPEGPADSNSVLGSASRQSVGVPNNDNNNNNNNKATVQQAANSVYSRYNLTIDMLSCIYDKRISMANYVSVVSRCPDGQAADVAVTGMCHSVSEDDMITRLPVSGTVTRLLYRNMFCAICHQVSLHQVLPLLRLII